jgi:serine/threonine protein kinase
MSRKGRGGNLGDYYFPDSKKTKVSVDYDIIQKLGVGSFGFVKKGRNKRNGELVAIKCCEKNKCPPTPLIQEVELLKLVRGNDSVVQLIEVYESKTKINMVMEFICGGELFDKIVELESYKEADAAKLFKQIVEGVKYCHSMNVVHRDLKPENLMFADEEATVLKLIDFGVSAILSSDDDILYDRVGTRTYMAPEISKLTGYGKPCDLYSLGVILYILLVGYPPFDEEEGITDLEFPADDWEGISQEVISLIRNLLSDNPTERMNIM